LSWNTQRSCSFEVLANEISAGADLDGKDSSEIVKDEPRAEEDDALTHNIKLSV